MKPLIALPRFCVIATAVVACAVAPATLRAFAADVTFEVDTTADLVDADTTDGVCRTSANTCSLRAAVMQANHLDAPAVIRVDVPAGVYTLTLAPDDNGFDEARGALWLRTPAESAQRVELRGAGAATTIIDASLLDRALFVDAHRDARFSGLTFRNGSPPNLDGSSIGGGVLSFGALALADCIVEDSTASGIGSGGGGLASYGTLDMARTTVRGNLAAYGGGMSVQGPADIRDSVIYDNAADVGGGISVSAPQVDLAVSIVDSTISGNRATTEGGGVDGFGLTLLYNATVVGNRVTNGADGAARGGGVYNGTKTRFVLVNSIVAGNSGVDAMPDDCGGAVESRGRNLVGDLTVPGCDVSGEPLDSVSIATIGPLQDNGGPTLTHALLAGSEAMDGSDDAFGCPGPDGAQLATDQRGFARPVGARCDVGAFEAGSSTDDVVFRNGFDSLP